MNGKEFLEAAKTFVGETGCEVKIKRDGFTFVVRNELTWDHDDSESTVPILFVNEARGAHAEAVFLAVLGELTVEES